MEALRASYADSSSDSDSGSEFDTAHRRHSRVSSPLPPPPLSLLTPPNFLDYLDDGQASRVRSFPHVEGNYALHVFIPVYIPSTTKKALAQFLKKVAIRIPDLHVVDVDIPLSILCKDDQKIEQVLGRQFHISLGRTVAIRVHQIESMVAMLRQKLQMQRRFWIDFNKWEAFVNDDHTRSFLSVEIVTGGVAEITKQIQSVNEVYKLHNLPEFYKDPRPHISLAWASGDIGNLLKAVIEEEMKRLDGSSSSSVRLFTVKFSGIECKIGSKVYDICKFSQEL